MNRVGSGGRLKIKRGRGTMVVLDVDCVHLD